MDMDKAWYIFRYYGHLMNELERAANRHLTGTIKATHGRSDAAAQVEARTGSLHLRRLLSDEPQVLGLARNGFQAFVVQTAERIIGDYPEKIVLNCCPNAVGWRERQEPISVASADMIGTKKLQSHRKLCPSPDKSRNRKRITYLYSSDVANPPRPA